MVTLKFKTFSEFHQYAKRVKEERERSEGQASIAALCASCGEKFVPSNYAPYWQTPVRLAIRCPHCGAELEIEHLNWEERVTDAEAVALWGHSGPKEEV